MNRIYFSDSLHYVNLKILNDKLKKLWGGLESVGSYYNLKRIDNILA